jgi:hypothetical protein
MAYTDSLAATAKGNHVKLTGGAKLDLHAIGGMAQGETGAEASGNSVTVEKNSFVTGDIHGGRAYAAHGDATVEKNEVIIDSSTVNGNVFGAWADSGINSTVKAERNTVTIRGGAISGTLTVVGGQATGSTAHATGNTVNISGALTGTLVDVIGGRLTNNTDGTATGNTVNIRDIPAITGKLFGGETDPGTLSAVDFFSGNTLNLYSADFSVGDDLGGFEFLNFILPETVTSGVTILKLAGAADLTGVNIGIAIDGAKAPLPEGFEVTLIDTTGTGSIAGTPFMSAQARHGAIKYEITDLGSLKVALGNSSLDDGAKSWSEGYLASTAFLAQGSDFLTSRGLQAAQGALAGKPSGMESFAAIGGGKLRHETGSHVDVDGYNLIAGVTSGFITDTGKANLSAFFELGDGDYTSHNSFASGKVNGRGDTGYKGLGLMGRLELGKDAWLEGSLRGGKTDVDYRMDGSPTVTGLYLSRYDAKSNYFGAHLGVGETRKLSEADNLDVYLQFLWTHQGRDSATPPEQSGATLKFDAIDSKRVKVGVRLKHAFTPGFSGYAGLSYDHETSARASATLEGGGVSYEIKAPDMKGGTGAVEFGFSGRPMASQPLYLDLGVQGHGGQRQGVTASVRASYLF